MFELLALRHLPISVILLKAALEIECNPFRSQSLELASNRYEFVLFLEEFHN